MNRRDFLAAGAAGLAASQFAFADSKPKRAALIGCGWYGKNDLFRLLQVAPVDVVGLCDVDKKMLAEAAELTAVRQRSKKKPPTYADYKTMLKEQSPEIVLVGTPDHWHALAMIDAVASGADVYVQKPISVDVVEGQAMLAAARKHKRVVQVGTQRRSTPHLVEARDRVINEGLLGKIAHVELYCYYHMRARGNPPVVKPPAHFDYDMWCGPAPKIPYVKTVHPRSWRAFTEYGNGIMGDMCIHMLDMVRWMLKLGWPKRISSAGGILVDKKSVANIPDTQTATFDFGDLTAVWQHRSWGNPPDPQYPWGATIYGDKGMLRLSVKRYDFTPRGKGKALSGTAVAEPDKYPEEKTEPRFEKHAAVANRDHMRDFLRAVASRGKPVADIEEGHISSASCILANMAMSLSRALTWDAEAGRVAGDDEANRLLARPYREPWKHPQV